MVGGQEPNLVCSIPELCKLHAAQRVAGKRELRSAWSMARQVIAREK